MVIRDCLKAGHNVFQLVNRYTLQGIGSDFIGLQYTVICMFRGMDRKFFLSFDVFFSFLFMGREVTTWPANSCLQISVMLQIKFRWCVIETSLLCENGGSVLWEGRELFDIFSWSKERWSNDKIIIQLGYRKMSWFVSVPQNNCLPEPSSSVNNWSARYWQITILTTKLYFL